MGRYIVRRIWQAFPLVIIVSVVCFLLLQATTDPIAMYTITELSGDDVIRIRHQLGLDRPIYVQYASWLRRAIVLDWGYSFASRRPVSDMLAERLPRSLILGGAAEVVVVVTALAVGTYAAFRQYSLFDNLMTAACFIVYSMPVFWLALVLMYIFAVYFKEWGLPYLPTGGDVWDHGNPLELIRHLILPVLTLASVSAAYSMRYMRSSMLEVINQDYIRTARAKGLVERAVVLRHALKNAAIPLVTLIGLDLPALIAGAIVTETVFSWPGMGRLFWEGVNLGDYPVVMAILFLVSVAVIVCQLLVDVVYALLDPRIHYA